MKSNTEATKDLQYPLKLSRRLIFSVFTYNEQPIDEFDKDIDHTCDDKTMSA